MNPTSLYTGEGHPPIPYAVHTRGGQPYAAPGPNIYSDMVTENIDTPTYGVDELGWAQATHAPARSLPRASILRPGTPFGIFLAPMQRELDRGEGQ